MSSRLFIRRAAQLVWDGGVIAYPTEAVFGLGCDPLNENAVMRILSIKHRNISQGVILIASSFDVLSPFFGPLTSKQTKRLSNSWPGPITWLVPAHSQVPHWLTGDHDTLAVRVTAHPVARELAAYCHMPLVSTSANVHGQAPTTTRLATQLRFGLDVDCIVPGRVGRQKNPTEIRDLLSNQVIRGN